MFFKKAGSCSRKGIISKARCFFAMCSYRVFFLPPPRKRMSGIFPTITMSSTLLMASVLVGIEIRFKRISGFSFAKFPYISRITTWSFSVLPQP